jgi:hypothetical protein
LYLPRQIIYAASEGIGMCEIVQFYPVKEKYEWFTTGAEQVDDLMDGGIATAFFRCRWSTWCAPRSRPRG